MAFFDIAIQKRGFRITPIFNGLQPSKKAVHPCTARACRIWRNSAALRAACRETEIFDNLPGLYDVCPVVARSVADLRETTVRASTVAVCRPVFHVLSRKQT